MNVAAAAVATFFFADNAYFGLLLAFFAGVLHFISITS